MKALEAGMQVLEFGFKLLGGDCMSTTQNYKRRDNDGNKKS